MRYVVLHGCLWDDLYIGFQNQISRDPDVYHHKYTHAEKIIALISLKPIKLIYSLVLAFRFWNHFQTQLPLRCPDWGQFLQKVTPIQETDASHGGLLRYCSVL
ncbi:hypothetical protein AMECASPLE_033400 [Ameca splendens]|uniref:Uncharacterized protein n=1 Tax=Ameca splendens TaxID=208324 RepID=A0ABV1AEP2_9TELE